MSTGGSAAPAVTSGGQAFTPESVAALNHVVEPDAKDPTAMPMGGGDTSAGAGLTGNGGGAGGGQGAAAAMYRNLGRRTYPIDTNVLAGLGRRVY